VNHANHTFAAIVTGEARLQVFEQVRLSAVVVQSTRQRGAQTSEVSSTVLVGNVIGVAKDLLHVGAAPLDG
jgi:hypothetical protein